ncbi:MAG: hypothetical protein ABIR62_05855 [Dokdonella sp.]|uniref:beta strand repeat-containing protein n=1 Tax=Dokdonella sp. TaxID=2291710 RepID=UPI0032649ED1
MNVSGKILGLVLASLAMASCGGGGGGGSFQAPTSGTLTLSATTTTLPTNTGNYSPDDHGPNQAEITITARNPNGSLMPGDITVAISPVNVAAISVLNDGTATSDQLFGTYPIKGSNGVATAFVNARLVAGTTVFTATTQDASTGRTISQTLTFTVTSGVGNSPATVDLAASPSGVYLPSSGGNNASSIKATVRDGGGQFVPDPATGNSGVDNVQFQIISDAGNATLSSNSVTGPVSGTTVTSHTVQGQATASFQAGDTTPLAPIQIRATVDRADNNVSNGIQDPVSQTTSVIVSDGKLYSIQITSPIIAPSLPGITINCVTDPCPDSTGNVSADVNIPPNPDATLSLVVTAKAQDRQGNPVLPGTPIRFGSVDEPVGAPGASNDNEFLLSGFDGNPQEGGTTFTAPTGHFTGANGAGPGDALVVFGQAVPGNADLESAVTVTSVNSATNLTVRPAFNRNDTTGASVDQGPILPYLIGRSRHGSITAVSTTDASGVAHASLTYTVSTVGSSVAIWAQGDGIDRVTNGANVVTDAGTLTYPGVAPATISASPDPIIGDTTSEVTVCVADALGIPLRGLPVGFQFVLTGGGTGSIDGVPGSGVFADLTNTSGCATGVVVTAGIPAGAAGGVLNLSAAGQTTSVNISVQVATLQVSPNSVHVPTAGNTTLITVTARTASGSVVPGAVITGTCSASQGTITLTPSSASTSASGTATFSAAASGFVSAGTPPTTGTGSCVFSTPGSGSATVTFSGTATCNDFSPPTCPPTP